MKTMWRTLGWTLTAGWVVTLALPVASFGTAEGETWFGWAVLLLGWLGFFLGQFAWLANFLFAAAIIMLIRGRPPLVWGLMIGVLTSLLALHALSWNFVYQTGGGTGPILAYGSGYYLWILVTFAAGLGVFAAALQDVRAASGAARA
jgi:hypothetical protein